MDESVRLPQGEAHAWDVWAETKIEPVFSLSINRPSIFRNKKRYRRGRNILREKEQVLILILIFLELKNCIVSLETLFIFLKGFVLAIKTLL